MSRMYSRETIESLIKKLDDKLKEKVEVIAIGGTALALLGERTYSRDIDICYGKCKFPPDFAQAVIDSAKDVDINPKDVEMFGGFEMTLLEMPRFSERAIPYKKFRLKNIDFKIMHPVDIILSKIYRGEPRDIRDAKDILDDKKATMPELKSRFIEVFRNQNDITIREDFAKKYETFLKAYHQTKNK